MSLLFWIIVFSLLGGLLSVLAAATFMWLPGSARDRLVPHLVSFAIGALLGAAFLALLPHSFGSNADLHILGLTVLLGILAFFLLEKMVLWRHCHTEHCEAHGMQQLAEHHHAHEKDASGTLILIGDAMHNLVDGVLIAAAFLTDFHLGVITSLAVATHEIPQELGDFGVLLHSGFSRARALFFNILSSLTTVIGAVVAYFSLSGVEFILPYVLAVAASSFIYIAVADLIPGLHKRTEVSVTFQQISLIIAGVVIIYYAHSTLH